MDIVEFLTTFAPQLEERVDKILSPLYKMRDEQEDFGSLITPFPVQRESVKALAAGYASGRKSLFLVAEMGCGKTLMATWLSQYIRAKRTLVVCPPHLVRQWEKEIIAAYPGKVVMTIPDQDLKKLGVSNMAALQEIHRYGAADFVVISREAIKTDYPSVPCTVRRTAGKKEITGQRACPACFGPIEFNTLEKLHRVNVCCEECGSPLFTYVRQGGARPSLAKYIQKKMKGFFDFTVFDEAHEFKSENTAQGAVLGKLGTKGRVLAMTGTFMGGMATDVFYLLQRTSPGDMKREGFSYRDSQAFVEQYGVMEKITKKDEEQNKQSIGRSRKKERVRERPGISPLFIGNFLLDKAVFLRLSDFAEHLPIFTEHPVACRLHPALEEGYRRLSEYPVFIQEAKNRPKVQSTVIQALLAWPDFHGNEVILDEDEYGALYPFMEVPGVELPLGATEKEMKLVEVVKKAKAAGKKVLLFTTQTKKRNLQPRIARLLQEQGIRTSVMGDSVSTWKRSEWIESQTPKSDAVLCHPAKVKTGLNLLKYPVIVFYDCGYSTYTLRQSSRRSYRVSQSYPEIDVYYFFTEETIQADCLSLMAVKNEVSLLVEGEVQEGGLSAMSEGGGSILGQLAKVIAGELRTENPLEVFSRLNRRNNEGKVRKDAPAVATPREATGQIVPAHGPIQVSASRWNAKGQAFLPF